MKAVERVISEMSKSQLHSYLLRTLENQRAVGLDSDKSIILEKITFCHSAAVSFFNISSYMMKKVLNEHKYGQIEYYHNNKGSFQCSEKRDRIITFIESFARCHSENLPDKNVLRLPSYMNVATIYESYKASVHEQEQLSERTFYHIFQTIFGNPFRIDLDKPRITFLSKHTHPVCTECAKIQVLCQVAKSSSDQAYAENRKKSHLLEIRKKYLKCCERKELSIRFPDDYLYLTFDDIDQSKIKSPFPLKYTKDIVGLLRLNNHCTGLKAYNGKLVNDCLVFAFLNNNQFKQDSNKTISILFDVLYHIQMKLGQLPKKLFIQTDNCGRDLKNQFVFTFYWTLVDLNIFEEIIVSHMPVGHTHGEVDQMFSVFASYLRKIEIPSFEYLLEELKNIKINGNSVLVKEMIFTSDFVQKAAPSLLNIEGHSSFSQFKFRRENNRTRMYVKADELESPWQFGSGVKLFEKLPNFSNLSVAPFREDNEYSDIFHSVWTKYIPTLKGKFSDADIRSIELKWETRINMLIDLDTKNYKAFNISLLKPIVNQVVVPEDPADISFKEPSLRATFYPIELKNFSVDDLVKDCSVVLYTKSKSTRPWIGLFIDKCDDTSGRIKVQWLKKERKLYKPDILKDGSPYVSDVEIESVMFSHVLNNVSFRNDSHGPYFLDKETKKLIDDAYLERDMSLK